ncbi:glycoside hydrolase [Saitoella complicata NRRL Y-17804]|nr:glycoside hydrolase [Saitoella complicata NRRL Y-17804]ODQ51086.1 glycoside hydrolase [Saitoella complicata NRRL Y-17804]
MHQSFFAGAFTVLVSALGQVQSVNAQSNSHAYCDSPIYCPGEILQNIQLAQPFDDSKTFVDLPTIRPLDEVLAAWANLTLPFEGNDTLSQFLDTYFGQPGTEIEAVNISAPANPAFLRGINDTVVKGFASAVNGYWPQLARRYVGDDVLCDGCVSSFIPVNRTFVVAGGRFREYYYWDSFFIIEGLLLSELYDIASNIILNFLDLVDQFGFMPNGGRIYYLNRSQPPFLTQMVRRYVDTTGDVSFLERALPTLDLEYQFWMKNTTVRIQSPYSNTTRHLNRYYVNNTQPRPESYLEDYQTAHNTSFYGANGTVYPARTNLSQSQIESLYSDLATGAETGWDYSSRWLKQSALADNGNAPNDYILRTLNTRNIVPVDLNSILYYNEVELARFWSMIASNTTANSSIEVRNITTNATTSAVKQSQFYTHAAQERKIAMQDLLWDAGNYSFYDFNLTSNARNKEFTPANYLPFWAGAAPEWTHANTSIIEEIWEPVLHDLTEYPGGVATSDITTGLQWDFPNVWPPLQYLLMEGLIRESNATFARNLTIEIAQRYMDSAFCSWYATGGSVPNVLPQLPGESATGNIFEKFNASDIDAAGGGGEYTVAVGFGWTNGVILWTANQYGDLLQTPDCGNITAASTTMKRRSLM